MIENKVLIGDAHCINNALDAANKEGWRAVNVSTSLTDHSFQRLAVLLERETRQQVAQQ